MKPPELRETGQEDFFQKPAWPDRLSEAPAREARRLDRATVFRKGLRRGLYRCAGPAASARAADGGARDPEIYLQPPGRAGLRGLA